MTDDRIIRTLPADLLTPVGAYLLESVERGEQVGRHSFLAAGCETTDSLEEAMAFTATRPGPGRGDPPFVGGAVGHLSYDWATQLEPVPLPPAHPDDAGLPLMRFMLADSVVAFEHVRRTMSLIGPRKAVERLVVAMSRPPATAAAAPRPERAAHSELTRERYMAAVEKASEHIAAGDALQIVHSQR